MPTIFVENTEIIEGKGLRWIGNLGVVYGGVGILHLSVDVGGEIAFRFIKPD